MGLFSKLIRKSDPSDLPIPKTEKQYYQKDSYYTDYDLAGNKVIRLAERKKSSYPSKNGLYVPEILLLSYCGKYPNPKSGYQAFWWFKYGIRNVGAVLDSLMERGFIELDQTTGKYKLTELGKQELRDNEYVEFMHKNSKFADFTAWEMNQELANKFIDDAVKELKEQIKDDKVLLALSGGVDSSVTAALLIKAIGKNLICVHVNHGLLRKNESEGVINTFKNELGATLIYVDAVDRFLDKLKGVADPEQKRKIIGKEFIDVFAEEAKKHNDIKFLAQGTIYPDILESKGIKSHHNVGGLPEDLKFELVEPVKFLYKDEVRQVGLALGLKESMVFRQPFPGPGLGVRCVGAITRDRLELVRESDAILREEFAKSGLDKKFWQYFTIVPDYKSVGIEDNKRNEKYFVVIRAVNSVDATTATADEIPYNILTKIRDRILKEVKGVNRVLVDITPKPTGTIEWE